jgi:propionyl-CoA synthetase
MEECLMSH